MSLIANELSSVDLGDARLNRRALAALTAINEHPSRGFPEVFGERAALLGFYRLVNNDAVEPDALRAPHGRASWRRAAMASTSVLVLHDTSAFTYKGESARVGLAQKKTTQGFHGHVALAVAEGEAPVVHGIVGNRNYVVENKLWKEAVEGRAFKELRVGSERWSLLAAQVHNEAPDGLGLIHVMDREADDYSLWTSIIEQGDDFVIRAKHNRCLEGRDEKVRTALDGVPFVASREVALSRRGHRRLPNSKKSHPARDQRQARLSIRAGRVEIKRPAGVAPLGCATVTLSMVEVVEIDPLDGVTPVRWVILSTLPITTPQDVLRIVDIYRKRWLIEEYFKALKTGCAAEKRQGRSLWTLLNTIALLMPVAWRLLAARAMARHQPNSPATNIIDAVELAALRRLAPKATLPTKPTCRQVLLAIARVGGHLRSNGEPGWLVIGRGMEQLLDFAAGWRAALDFVKQTGELEM